MIIVWLHSARRRCAPTRNSNRHKRCHCTRLAAVCFSQVPCMHRIPLIEFSLFNTILTCVFVFTMLCTEKTRCLDKKRASYKQFRDWHVSSLPEFSIPTTLILVGVTNSGTHFTQIALHARMCFSLWLDQKLVGAYTCFFLLVASI